MRKSIVVLCFMFASALVYAQQQGQLTGTVSDRATGERIPMAKIILLKKGVFIVGVLTNLEGEFSFKNLETGKYDVRMESVEYHAKTIEGIEVELGRPTHLELTMNAHEYGPPGLVIRFVPKLVDVGDMTHGHIFKSNEIKRSSFR